MRLTGADINKVYSEQLAKLLLDGYTLVVARESSVLKVGILMAFHLAQLLTLGLFGRRGLKANHKSNG